MVGKVLRKLLLPALLFFPIFSQAEIFLIDDILNLESEPAGVVFEIVSGDSRGLSWALPQVRTDAARLRKRFPDIAIAVVTHGREQFGLQKSKAADNPKIQQLTRSLVKDQDISLHVCGTYASWFDVSDEDFPDYVDVAPAGPTQINLYKEVGYLHVEVKKP